MLIYFIFSTLVVLKIYQSQKVLMPEASSQSSRRPLMSASTIIMVNSKRIVLETSKGLCWKQQSASTSYRTRIFTTKNSASGRRRPGRLPMSISGEPQKSAKLKESIIVSISPDLDSKKDINAATSCCHHHLYLLQHRNYQFYLWAFNGGVWPNGPKWNHNTAFVVANPSIVRPDNLGEQKGKFISPKKNTYVMIWTWLSLLLPFSYILYCT